MRYYLITFRSVTYAQRGEQALNSAGFHCSLGRTPRWMEEQGCGYALRVWCEDAQSVLWILRREKLPLRRVYAQGMDGTLEAVAI